MNQLGPKIVGAARAVEATMGAITKDVSSGMGSFLSGERAHTHEVAAVGESRGAGQQSDAITDRSSSGQVIANQIVDGRPAFLIQTQNEQGQPHNVLLEKGDRDWAVGQQLQLTWGRDGQLTGAEIEHGYDHGR